MSYDPWSRFSKEAAEIAAYTYSGYNLPMIQLDETGPSYVILPPHPSLYNQPEELNAQAVSYGAGSNMRWAGEPPILPLA